MHQANDQPFGSGSELRNRLRDAGSAVVDFVLPPACAFCTRDLQNNFEATGDGIKLCGRCRKNFTSDERSPCQKCGMPVGPYVDTSLGCAECSRRNFQFERVIRLGVYEDYLRTACIRGKSRGAEALAAGLAALLWKKHLNHLDEFAPDLVVPIPQYWLHRFTRPHHQALTMAEVLAERIGIPCNERAVRKTRRTIDQSSLPRAKRLTNFKRAYRVGSNHQFTGRRVLIVDDILTTGTTSNEVAKVIAKAGATAIAVAVIAVVP
ncbi:MAG: ComF family protein [Planctomycetales bacterium]